MKIVIIGADGQLGMDLVKVLDGEQVLPLYYPDFDVTRTAEMRDVLRQAGGDMVVNTAAFHRVDECEDNPRLAFEVNSLAVRELALFCRETGTVLMHFSTDYVFDGLKNSPYTEEDPPHPLSVYAMSKLAGEVFVRNICERHFLIRTCGLFGTAGSRVKGTNFVESVIGLDKQGKPLRIVDDQRVTPTSTAELARKIKELIGTSFYGLYHMTCEGDCTWLEFAQEIFSLLGREPRIEPVSSKDYGSRARRPRYSVLENRKAKSVGLPDFLPWRPALKEYLVSKGHLA